MMALACCASCESLLDGLCWDCSDDYECEDGDCCSTGEFDCGPDAIRSCGDDKHWNELVPCSDLCALGGFERSFGCEFDFGQGRSICLCGDELPCECEAGMTGCWEEDFLLACDDGCHWSATPCVVSCGNQTSLGCDTDPATGQPECICES